MPTTTPSLAAQDAQWRELKTIIEDDNGLLQRRYGYYLVRTLIVLGFLGLGIAGIVILVENLPIVVGLALLFAATRTQFGLLAHAAIHSQIFQSRGKNAVAGHAYGFGIGFPTGWWERKHNRLHHGSPNNADRDGDIHIIWVAFTLQQGASRNGFNRWMVEWQNWTVIPVLFLSAISMWFAGLNYLISPKEEMRSRGIQWFLFWAHVGAYAALLILFLDSWLHIMVFVAVTMGIQGLYMGSIFATNHKGMEVLDDKTSEGLGFIRQQVPTSRDVRVPWFLRSLVGGLDFQIEHHLFPNMPESSLGKAQPLVQKFCIQNNIPYTRTGFLEAIHGILVHLCGIATKLRTLKEVPSST